MSQFLVVLHMIDIFKFLFAPSTDRKKDCKQVVRPFIIVHDQRKVSLDVNENRLRHEIVSRNNFPITYCTEKIKVTGQYFIMLTLDLNRGLFYDSAIIAAGYTNK